MLPVFGLTRSAVRVQFTVSSGLRARTLWCLSGYPFDAYCCHMGTAAIKHPVPDRVKPSFVMFDIRAL